MAKPSRITVSQVDGIATKLRQIPTIEKTQLVITKLDSIRMLTKEITLLRQRRYTLTQIAELLSNEGLEITDHMLTVYLAKIASSKSSKASKGENRKTKDTPEAARAVTHDKGSFRIAPDTEDI
jgi:hypothetical protein